MVAAIWMLAGAVFGGVCGWLAIPRNRSAVTWWFLGVLTGPVALGVLLAQGRREGPKALL